MKMKTSPADIEMTSTPGALSFVITNSSEFSLSAFMLMHYYILESSFCRRKERISHSYTRNNPITNE